MNIENKKQLAIILLAVGLGLMAAVLTGRHIQGSIQDETRRLSKEFEEKKMKPLIQEMAVMREDMKKMAARQAQMPAGVPGKPGEGKPGDATPAIPKSTLSLMTPAGKRAYTVNIDSLSAVGGMVNPGDYVDVLAHVEMADAVTNKPQKISSVVFQNVKILAVGTNLQAPGGYEQQQAARALNITFALTPEEAGLMSFIQKNGQMQLVLRAPSETQVEMLQTANWSTLADYVFNKQGTELVLQHTEAKVTSEAPEKKDAAKPYIQIFRGGLQQ